MAEEPTELPIVEEPTVTEPPVEEPNVDDLVTELKKAGVSNPQELQGKLEAGAQAGHLAQLLGDERKEKAAITAELEALRSKPRDDYMDAPEGQTVDIEAVVARSVSGALDARDKKALQIQASRMQSWNTIQGDEDYALVKDVWENQLKDTNFVFKINSGAIDPVKAYTATVRGYYKRLLKQSSDTIETMRGGSPTPPHIETGERAPGNLVSTTPGESGAAKVRGELKQKVDKGGQLTSEEELSIIDSIFAPPA